MIRLRLVLPLLVILWLGVTAAVAQTGGLRVQVLDSDAGQPLPGATVLLSNVRRLIADTAARTDEGGEVEFPVLRAGSGYVVEVRMTGYASYRLPELRVRPGETRSVTLQLGSELRESVRVEGVLDGVDLDRSGLDSRFSDDFLVDLPIPGRFYQNVLVLAPGVNDSDGDGNPNVHGSRSRDFNAKVGGVSNVDPLTGRWLDYVNSDSIEEIEVVTAGGGAEFGRAQGGFANVVQKQGGNIPEGTLGYVYRDARLDGTGATGLRSDVSPDFEWRQPSLQLSGPVVKDRFWYRLSHEWIDRDDPRNFSTNIALERIEQAMHSDQFTWQVSPRNKLAFQYQYAPVKIENFGISDIIPAESTRTVEAGGPVYSIRVTSPKSPRLLLEGMVAYQDYERKVTPTTRNVPQDCLVFSRFDLSRAFRSTRCFNSDTTLTSGSHPERSQDRRQRLTVNFQGTAVPPELFGMRHRVKFGLGIENERYFRDLERGPDIRFNVEKVLVDPCPFGGSRPCFQDIGFAAVDVPVPRTTSSRATGISWGLFGEDQVQVLDNLTVTAGLRIDRDEIQSGGQGPFDPDAEADEYAAAFEADCTIAGFPTGPCVQRLTSEIFTSFADVGDFAQELRDALRLTSTQISLGTTATQSTFWLNKRRSSDLYITNTNLSPRLAVAWDPASNGRTKLSVTAGRYYDRMFLAIPLLELEPTRTTLLFSSAKPISFGSPNAPQVFVAFTPDQGVKPAVGVTLVDRNLGTPYQDELTLGFEREVWTETSVRFTYVNRRFRDQLQDVDINHRTGDFGLCVRPLELSQPTVVRSDGSGFTVVDVYTGEEYEDTDPGPGDGRLDDCSGNVEVELVSNVFPPTTRSLARPDGLDDLYVANPGWGELLLVSNLNTSDYEAFVLELIRRYYRGWELQASYTWSEAVGDAEDFVQSLGNERNLFNDERGFLSYDQRHVVRVNATTVTPWGFRLGGALRWESGLPFSILSSNLTLFSVPSYFLNLGDVAADFRLRYPTRQRNDQRNPSFWTLDMRLAREWTLGSGVLLQTTVEVFNLLNDDTPRVYQRLDGINSGERRFGRRWQLGMRLTF